MQEIMFWILATLMIATSLGVVLAKSPVYSALSLVFTLIGTAAIFAMLGAHFLAVAQLIIYAGSIVVLFLFVLMLLDIKQERFAFKDALFLLLAVFLAGDLAVMVLPYINESFKGKFITHGLEGTVSTIGNAIFSLQSTTGSEHFNRWLFAFEASALLLIVAMVAGVMLAKKPKNGFVLRSKKAEDL